jgi:hypothetical protein
MRLLPALLVAVVWIGIAPAQKNDPAKKLDDWKYPEATLVSSGGVGDANHLLLVTKDPLEKVAAFYGKKVGQKLSNKPGDPPGGSGVSGGTNGLTFFQDDSAEPGSGPIKRRPVTVRIFVEHSKDHDLTLVISRGDAEEQTHIYVNYVPK